MSSGDEPKRSQTLTDEGVELFNKGEYDDALMKLEEALALDRDDARALGVKGSVLRMRDEPEKASETLRRAAHLSSGSSWILAEWGEAQRMQGLYEEALDTLEQALDADPDNTFALGTKGVILFEKGHYKRALQTLDQALAVDPDNAFALGVKGTVLAEMNRYDEALATLDVAPPEDPNYRYVLAVRAQMLCDSAYYESGLEDVNDALRLGLDNITTLALKGWALQNLDHDRVSQALDVYEEALQRNPSTAQEVQIHTHYGRALSVLRRWEAAGAHYRTVIQQTGEHTGEPDALFLASLAWCHYGVGQYKEAGRLLIAASSLNKGLIFTQFDIALVLMCSGQCKHAYREYRLALQLTESKHILRRRGLVQVALSDLELALAQRPELLDNKEAHRAVRLLQDARGDIEKELLQEN